MKASPLPVVPGFSYARGVLTFDEGTFMLAFEAVS
jgi:hypothetical protein